MKKIFLTFLILFVANQLYAQSNAAKYSPSPYYYDTCQYLQQYAGTWMYTNGNDTIKVFLRFHKDSSENLQYISNKLYGWHEYKQGNTIIQSDYQNRFLPMPYFIDTANLSFKSIILQLWTCSPTQDTLTGTITDYNQANEIHRIKAVLNAARTQMVWNLEHKEWYGAWTGAYGMTLPKQIILIKQ